MKTKNGGKRGILFLLKAQAEARPFSNQSSGKSVCLQSFSSREMSRNWESTSVCILKDSQCLESRSISFA